MEIERKYLVAMTPNNLAQYDSRRIEQGYLNTNPVVRVRRQDEEYYLTYKGSGMLAREEYNLALDAESYAHMIAKADGNIITKTRYLIPYQEKHIIELDVFDSPFAPLIIAEVEFESTEDADAFIPPSWFGAEVTYDKRYHNSTMSQQQF